MKAAGKIWVFFNKETKKKSKPLSLDNAQLFILGLSSSQQKTLYVWTPGWSQWEKLGDFLKKDSSYFVTTPEHISTKKKNSISDTDLTKTISIEVTEESITVDDSELLFSDKNPPNPLQKTNHHPSHNENNQPQSSTSNTNEFHGDQLLMENPKAFSLQSTVSKPTLQSTASEEKRKQERFNYTLEVILISKNGKTFRSQTDNISIGGASLVNPIPKDFFGIPFDLVIVNQMENDAKKSRILFKGKVISDISNTKRLTFIDPSRETVELLNQLLNLLARTKESPMKKAN